MLRCGRRWALVLGLGLAFARTSAAEPTADERARLAALLHQGDDAAKAKDWKACIAARSAALAIEDAATIAGDLGLCEERAGRFGDAMSHVLRALAEATPAMKANEPWRSYQAAELRLRSHVTMVALTLDPTDALVLLDGQPLGKADGRILPLTDGKHTFVVRAEGYEEANETQLVTRGVRNIHVSLKPKPTPPAPAPQPAPVPVPPSVPPLARVIPTSRPDAKSVPQAPFPCLRARRSRPAGVRDRRGVRRQRGDHDRLRGARSVDALRPRRARVQAGHVRAGAAPGRLGRLHGDPLSCAAAHRCRQRDDRDGDRGGGVRRGCRPLLCSRAEGPADRTHSEHERRGNHRSGDVVSVAVMKKLGLCSMGLVALLLVGCGVDPGDTSSGGSGGGSSGGGGAGGSGGGLQCPDDPADGPVPPECGIWVSASKGDDVNEGTQAAPVATLAQAVALAEKGPRRVYACTETWTETTLTVPASVSLYGGFDCEAGWAYVGGENRRAILASASPIALKYIEAGTEVKPFVMDFDIESSDAVEPSGSSIAVFLLATYRVEFHRCEIVAGNGADGLDGEAGDASGEPAVAGAQGSAGASACSAPISKGGTAPENACELATSKGGAGGDGGPMTATNGGDGVPAGDPEAGKGGLGQQLAPACTGGGQGAAGAPGMPGVGGDTYDSHLTAEGFFGAPGADGTPGAPGQGGGGGGATLGSAAVCGAANPGGAGGGAGGTGGCGGKPGRGGRGGGGTFSLVASKIGPILRDTRVFTGLGGNGGNGGSPQGGATGGPGGQGGAGANSIKAGCNGGNGGPGGIGGWGGGGSGGTSLCLARPEGSEGMIGILDCYLGSGGDGGSGDPAFWDGYGSIGLNAGEALILP